MTRQRCAFAPALLALLLVVVAACSQTSEKEGVGADDGVALAPSTTADASTTTTQASTPPSTVYAPDSVEGEVEAAYLEAWGAYAEACSIASPAGLDAFYADKALDYRTESLQQLADEDAVGECLVDHQYNIGLVAQDMAAVVDNYVNHMRLIDPKTGSYLEPDPNVRDGSVYTLEKRDEAWIITDINGLEPS